MALPSSCLPVSLSTGACSSSKHLPSRPKSCSCTWCYVVLLPVKLKAAASSCLPGRHSTHCCCNLPNCCCLQAQLKESTVDKLRQAVPGLTDEHISIMKRCPMRSFDPMIKQEPHIYRQVAMPALWGYA